MTRYSESMYTQAIKSEIPIHKARKKKDDSSQLRANLESGAAVEPLTQVDIRILSD